MIAPAAKSFFSGPFSETTMELCACANGLLCLMWVNKPDATCQFFVTNPASGP